MSGKYDDRLAGYVEVKDRLKLFYEMYPDGGVVTSEVTVLTDPDGDQRVMVQAKAYRTPDDPIPAVGTSWMVLPGSTPYTKGSEVENTETSAWGRAIGALGIGIDKSIASGDEVRGKSGQDEPEPADTQSEHVELLGRIAKTGKLVKGGAGAYQGDWREVEGGHAIGFRLKLADRDIPQVLITGQIGEALYVTGEALLDQQVTVKGHLYNVKPVGRKAYYRLIVGDHPDSDYIETPDWRIPALDSSDPEPGVEAPAPDAPSILLFDADEDAAITAALP